MKKFYSFVLLVATLLLSTNIWAEGEVATVGDKSFTSLNGDDGAIATWIKDGGTLTLSNDCEYNATATVTIAKNATLDLNGKSLQWQYTSSATSCTAMLVTGNVTIKGGSIDAAISTPKCGSPTFMKVSGTLNNIDNVSINANFEETKKAPAATRSPIAAATLFEFLGSYR